MLRFAYTTLFTLIVPLLPLRLWWRGRREPGYRAHIGERFGRYVRKASQAGPLIWIHAVSVGETRAAQPLVEALRERYPEHSFLITQMTAAGRATAEELFGSFAEIAFLPYDLPWAMRRFLEHFRPRLGLLMETEVWPNLLRACGAAQVPVLLANARLSERSARGYACVRGLASEAFGDITAVAAQSEADATRLRALGAHDVHITGNLKFDIRAAPDAAALAKMFRDWFGQRPVLLAASTREGEEALILDALTRATFDALVVIVPRHPQRFDAVAALLRERKLPFVRRSEVYAGQTVPMSCRFVLGDSMGEMPAYYSSCDVAFIGGSLLPFGGQNLIEACAAGAPVLIGPHTFNFEQAATLAIAAGAAERVADADALVSAASRLLDDEAARARMSEAGREFCAAHRGATARVLTLCERLLTP